MASGGSTDVISFDEIRSIRQLLARASRCLQLERTKITLAEGSAHRQLEGALCRGCWDSARFHATRIARFHDLDHRMGAMRSHLSNTSTSASCEALPPGIFLSSVGTCVNELKLLQLRMDADSLGGLVKALETHLPPPPAVGAASNDSQERVSLQTSFDVPAAAVSKILSDTLHQMPPHKRHLAALSAARSSAAPLEPDGSEVNAEEAGCSLNYEPTKDAPVPIFCAPSAVKAVGLDGPLRLKSDWYPPSKSLPAEGLPGGGSSTAQATLVISPQSVLVPPGRTLEERLAALKSGVTSTATTVSTSRH